MLIGFYKKKLLCKLKSFYANFRDFDWRPTENDHKSMVKKKKIVTIKTSWKNVLLDNEAAEEFKETLEESVKKQHLYVLVFSSFFIGICLNEIGPREMNVEFIRAVLTVLNCAPISNTKSSFGNKLGL